MDQGGHRKAVEAFNARISEQIAERRVYDDTPQNRASLGLPG